MNYSSEQYNWESYTDLEILLRLLVSFLFVTLFFIILIVNHCQVLKYYGATACYIFALCCKRDVL